MQSLPQRRLLASQAAQYLAREIQRGRWEEWLPAERELAKDINVSRNTLRVALVELRRKAVVKPMHGRGNRIVGNPTAMTILADSREVAFICPRSLEQLRPMLTLWIDELRTLLSDHGCRVQMIHGPQYFQADGVSALEELVQEHPQACWVLVDSNEAVQRWFSGRQLPCIVAGTCFPNIDLPCVDLDHRAICRHAGGILLGLGHRRIGYIQLKQGCASETEGQEAFISSLAAALHRDVKTVVINCEPAAKNLVPLLRALMRGKQRPTALLIADPYCYLSVTTTLSQLGWKIPEQISVISRDEDAFLPFVVPTPARYAVSAHSYAKQMLRLILSYFRDGRLLDAPVRMIPEFVRGKSIATCPPG